MEVCRIMRTFLAALLIILSTNAQAGSSSGDSVWLEAFLEEPVSITIQKDKDAFSAESEKSAAIADCLKGLEDQYPDYKKSCDENFGRVKSSGFVRHGLLNAFASCQIECLEPTIQVKGCFIKKYRSSASHRSFFVVYQNETQVVVFEPVSVSESRSETSVIAKLIERITSSPAGIEKCSVK
jgi:hypothetical protein